MTEPREPEFPDAGGRPVLPTPPDLPVAPAQPTGAEAPAWSFGAPSAPRPEPGVVPAPVAADQPTAEPEPGADQPQGALLPEPPSVHSSEEDVPESVPAPAWTPPPEAEAPVTEPEAPEPEAPEPEPEVPAVSEPPAPAPQPDVPAPAWTPAPEAPTPEPEVPAAEPEPPVVAPAEPEPWQSSYAEPEPEQPWRPQAVTPQPVAESVEPEPDVTSVPAAVPTPVTAQSPAEPQRMAETVSPAPAEDAPVQEFAQPEPVASEWQPPAQPVEEPLSVAPAVPEPEIEPTLVTPVAEPVQPPEAAAAAEPGVWTHTGRPGADEPAASIWAPAPDTAPSAAEPAAAEEAADEPVVVPVLPPAPPLGAFVAPVQADPEATQSYPVTSARSPLAAPAEEPSDDDEIFRPSPGSLAGRMGSADQDEEERKLAAERNALREARAAALTTAGVPEPVGEAPAAVVEQVVEVKRTTDGFWGSLGLFLLRLVLAGTFGVWGVQMLLDPAKTQSLFATTVLSYPILATIVPVASLLISVSMVIGLATRYAAFGAALISIGALALVYWGSWSILVPNGFGFYGESELLIAAASLLIVFVGAGGWSLDGSLRRARAADKAARAS